MTLSESRVCSRNFLLSRNHLFKKKKHTNKQIQKFKTDFSENQTKNINKQTNKLVIRLNKIVTGIGQN